MEIPNWYDARDVVLSTMPEKNDYPQFTSLASAIVNNVNHLNWLASQSINKEVPHGSYFDNPYSFLNRFSAQHAINRIS